MDDDHLRRLQNIALWSVVAKALFPNVVTAAVARAASNAFGEAVFQRDAPPRVAAPAYAKRSSFAAFANAMTELELTPPLTRAGVKEAYRAAVKRHHPDQGGSAAKFRAVNDAYALLTWVVGT